MTRKHGVGAPRADLVTLKVLPGHVGPIVAKHRTEAKGKFKAIIQAALNG
jgi:hypothetical protein